MATAGSVVISLLMSTGSFETDTDRAAKRLKGLQKEAKAAGVALGVMGAAAAAGIVALVGHSIDAADEMSKMAQKIGISVESLSRLDYAAKLSDVSMETLANSVKRLGQFQVDALKGGKEQNAILDQLGVSAGSAETGVRDASVVLRELSDIFAVMPDGANKTALAVKLFGKSGADLIPMLNGGSKALDDFAKKSDLVGYTLDTKTGKSAEAVNDLMTEFKLSIDGIARQALPDLLPKLQDFGDLLNSQDVRDGFETIIGGAIKAVGALVKLASTTANVTKFLGEEVAARLHGPSLEDTVRVEQRIERLKKTINGVKNQGYGSPFAIFDASELVPKDLVSQKDDILKRLQGELDKEQNKLKIGMELNADAARAAAKIAAEAGKLPTVPTIDWSLGGTGGGKGGKKGKGLPDFGETHDDLLKLMEAEQRARDQFDAMAASLAGPVASANYQYAVDLQRLTDLAREGAIGTDELTEAQNNLRKAHEADLKAIQAQLTPAEQGLKYLQEETAWLRANEAGQLRLAAARMLGADATEEQIAQAVELMRVNDALNDHIDLMDDARDAGREFFDSMKEGEGILKSLEDAFGKFADALYDWATNSVIEQLFGKQGTAGSGSGGGWLDGILGAFMGGGSGSGGEAAGSLLDLFASDSSFGGAFARGGDVLPGKTILVGESGPELRVSLQVQLGCPRPMGEILCPP